MQGCGTRQGIGGSVILCLCSLTVMEMKGYAGGLGASASKRLAYRPTRGVTETLPTDDVGVSFTVCGSRYFGNLAHETKVDYVRDGHSRCAKVRRQG